MGRRKKIKPAPPVKPKITPHERAIMGAIASKPGYKKLRGAYYRINNDGLVDMYKLEGVVLVKKRTMSKQWSNKFRKEYPNGGWWPKSKKDGAHEYNSN